METLSTQSKMWTNAGHNNYDFVKIKLITELIMRQHCLIKIIDKLQYVIFLEFTNAV